MPLASTTTSLPTSMPQSWASAIRLVSGGLSALSGGSSCEQQLPDRSRGTSCSASISARKTVGLRSRDDHDRRIAGHRALLREHKLLDEVILAAERRRDRVVAVALGGRRVLFAVSLGEVHLPLLARDDLDDRVRDVLLAVGRDTLGAALVVEDDRAVLLDLVLPARRSASCRDRCTRS